MKIPQKIKYYIVHRSFGSFYLSREVDEFGCGENLERKNDEKYEQYLMKQRFNSDYNYEIITIIKEDENFYYISCPNKYSNQDTIVLKTKRYIDEKIKNEDNLFLI